MTTTNNLIDQVGGIEKAKVIVEGAPDGATTVRISLCGKQFLYGRCENSVSGNLILLNNLRTAIASHDEDHCNHEWNDLTSNGDKYRFLVCKHCDSTQNYLPLDESREFNVGDLVVLKQNHSQDKVLKIQMFHDDFIRAFADLKNYSFGHKINFRHATPLEIKAGRRLDHSVDVTDIRNHISPNTKVVNHG